MINENFSAVRLLIGHGADVNARDEDSWTPLHAAAAVGNASIIKLLLQNNADPFATTIFDERPIDLCETEDVAAISVLLDATKKNTKSSENNKFKNLFKLEKPQPIGGSPSSLRRSTEDSATKRFTNLFRSDNPSTFTHNPGTAKHLSKSDQHLPKAK